MPSAGITNWTFALSLYFARYALKFGLNLFPHLFRKIRGAFCACIGMINGPINRNQRSKTSLPFDGGRLWPTKNPVNRKKLKVKP